MDIPAALHLTNVRWRVTFLVAVVVALLYAPFVLSEDVGILLLTLLVLCPASAITSLALVIAAFARRKSTIATGLLVNGITVALVSVTMFWVISFHEGKAILAIENKIYWILNKKKYKEALRSQPPQWNQLSHIPFREWGCVGRTDVLFVFDPSDRLGDYIGRDGFVPNIPCPVWGIEKLSKNYYVVYDDAEFAWDYCPNEIRDRRTLSAPAGH